RSEPLAAEMPLLLKAGVALGADADNGGEVRGRFSSGETTLLRYALAVALASQSVAGVAHLAEAPRARRHLEGLLGGEGEWKGIGIHELALIDLTGTKSEDSVRVLASGVEPFVAPCVSPRFPVVAYGRRKGDGAAVDLELRSLQDGADAGA